MGLGLGWCVFGVHLAVKLRRAFVCIELCSFTAPHFAERRYFHGLGFGGWVVGV